MAGIQWVQRPFGTRSIIFSPLLPVVVATGLFAVHPPQIPLPLNTPTVIELENGQEITLTLIDANHCPGAVMYGTSNLLVAF